MHDYSVYTLEQLREQLRIHKDNLAVAKNSATKFTELYQPAPNHHTIKDEIAAIQAIQYEIARRLFADHLKIIDLKRVKLCLREAFGRVEPLGAMATNIAAAEFHEELLKIILNDVDGTVKDRFFEQLPMLFVEPEHSKVKQSIYDVRNDLDLHTINLVSCTQPQQVRSKPYLLIAFEPTMSGTDTYFVKAWIWRNSQSSLIAHTGQAYVYGRPNEDTDLEVEVQRIYELALTQLTDEEAINLTIEFFIPLSFYALDAPVHHININAEDDSGIKMIKHHPVHIRFFERTFLPATSTIKRARGFWKKKWRLLSEQFDHLENQVRQKFYIPHLGVTAEQIYDDLSEDESCYVCYMELQELCADDKRRLRKVAMQTGMGIGIWFLQYSDTIDGSCQETLFKLAVTNEFAFEIHRIRKREPWASSMILLWDDPSRIPEDAALEPLR